MDPSPQFVTATYEVSLKNRAQFLALMKEAEAVMRAEGLITERPAYRMASKAKPELILEIFEWVDETAFERAQKNPKVLAMWGQFETVWKRGGFGVNELPEASVPWAEFTSLP